MNETPPKNRRWFVILAAITLAGTIVFVGAITICALRIPELKKARFGVQEGKSGDRPC